MSVWFIMHILYGNDGCGGLQNRILFYHSPKNEARMLQYVAYCNILHVGQLGLEADEHGERREHAGYRLNQSS